MPFHLEGEHMKVSKMSNGLGNTKTKNSLATAILITFFWMHKTFIQLIIPSFGSKSGLTGKAGRFKAEFIVSKSQQVIKTCNQIQNGRQG